MLPSSHRTAWSRICAELGAADGTGLVSHEFFAAASAEQAVAAVEALAPAEVHLVVTAREPLGLFTASWQESLKNGSTTPMPDYARRVSNRPTDIWNWRTLDLRLVLERWTAAVPPERVHVLVLDPDAPRDDVWHRFAGIVGFPTDGIDLSGSFPNTSMGVAEAETLRRVNARLTGFDNAFDKGVYLRTFLADERLVPRVGRAVLARAGPDRGLPPARRRRRRLPAAHARRRRGRPRPAAGPGDPRAAPEHPVGHRRGGRRGRGRPGRDDARRRTTAAAGPGRRIGTGLAHAGAPPPGASGQPRPGRLNLPRPRAAARGASST